MADEIKAMATGSGGQYTEGSARRNQADMVEELKGAKGFDVINDDNLHTPSAGFCYIEIDFVSDAVIQDYTVDASAPIRGTIKGVTWNKGSVICGKFTSITLTSGAAIVYNGILM
jgi:hypothetical protein